MHLRWTSLSLDQARDIATRDPEDHGELFVPVAEFTWLTSVQFFKASDGVSHVSAVFVVGEILHGGRKHCRQPSNLVYNSCSTAVVPDECSKCTAVTVPISSRAGEAIQICSRLNSLLGSSKLR